jgi:hypothetical protein
VTALQNYSIANFWPQKLALHVAFMSRGVAGRLWKSLKNNENKLQHVQHENGQLRSDASRVSVCVAVGWVWLGN